MNATDVIETYLNDIARRLPRRERVDVANELRSLLTEELQARAKELGRPPDAAIALILVRDHGSPSEVAARYQTPWTIIDPADSMRFVKAALLGAGALIVLGAISENRPSPSRNVAETVKIGILAGLGILVLVFGGLSWTRRNWPKVAVWKPRDLDHVNRIGTAVAVPLAALCVVFYAAPRWFLERISSGRFETSWAAYTSDFQQFRLPCFIGLMAGLLVLLSFVAIKGRWRRLTRWVNLGLNLVLAALILDMAVEGNIFVSSDVDIMARKVLALVALVYAPSVAIMLHREIDRLNPVPIES